MATYQVHIKTETTSNDVPTGVTQYWTLPNTVRQPQSELEALEFADKLREVYVNVRVVKYTTKEEVIYQ